MIFEIENREDQIQNIVLALKDNLFDKTITTEDLIRISNKFFNGATFVVGKENGDIAGYVAFYCNDKTNRKAYISIIVLDQKYQHHGLGSLFLNEVNELSNKAGMQYVSLKVGKANEGAIKFYLKHEFAIVSEDDSQYCMEKQIGLK